MYRLDGRLIAMAILDFLPWCVSGVYFIYHSDFSQWGFGKLSACREAALAAEEGYKYYYMGALSRISISLDNMDLTISQGTTSTVARKCDIKASSTQHTF